MTTKTDNDQVQRFIFESCDIRGEIVTLQKSYAEACEHQALTSVTKQLLGEFLAAAAILGDSLKFKGTLTLQARGDGTIPLVMAETNHQGQLRGILKSADLVKTTDSTLPEHLGSAVLSMTVDPEKGERYQGIVPLQQDTLAGCLNDYFKQSEQLPTHFFIFSDDNHCGGIFLQALPVSIINDPDETKDKWNTAIQLASTLSQDELFNLNNEDILYRLFHELECKVFPPQHIRFCCNCNEERSSNAIVALGKDDALALLREREVIEINCDFCGKHYRFNEAMLTQLFSQRH